MKKIINIYFDVILGNSPAYLVTGTLQLDDTCSVKDLIKNYKIVKEMFPHRKIHLLIDETSSSKCGCNQRKITLKELKKVTKEVLK